MATGINMSEKLKTFLDLVDYCVRADSVAKSHIEHENKLQQDLLHEIEFESLAKNRSKTATKLHESRLERRYWKDIEEETSLIMEFLDDSANKKAIDKLKQVLGKSRKVEKYHEDRIYKPRALPDLQD